jgi:hypothetical protein
LELAGKRRPIRPNIPVRLKAHEIYQQIDPALVTQMLAWFRDNDRNVYKSAVSSLAQSRNLRLVFIQKKPVADQFAWILKTLKSRQSDTIGEHLVQAWLMAGNQELLVAFCDGVGIEHDGKGSVTGELPEELDASKVRETVNSMLDAFDPKLVTLYLTVFNLQQPGGWSSVSELLDSDERLALA